MNKTFFLIILSAVSVCIGNWETIGGNSARTSFLDVVGPESPNEILWEGSLESDGGEPILISNDKLITTRRIDTMYSPLVCHDLFTGDTLWTLDLPGNYYSISTPVGFRDNILYAANYKGTPHGDSLYAINAENGEIIWCSKTLIIGETSFGTAFTKNKDIILPQINAVVRIDHNNGELVWKMSLFVPVASSYCGLSILNDVAYGWNIGNSNRLEISAIDLEKGNIKYSIEIPTTNPPVGIAYGPLPVVDKDSTIYVHRANDNLVALKDNGTSFSIKWSIPIRDGGITRPAIGPDGSVYFANHNRIMRADRETGNILDSSIILWVLTTQFIRGSFSIDRNGTVFYNNEYVTGILYSFSKNLQLNWTDTIDVLGGPALSKHGLLAVSGKGNFLRVIKPVNLKIKNNTPEQPLKIVQVTSENNLHFIYFIEHKTPVQFIIYNIRGQKVYSRNNLPQTPGLQSVQLDDINNIIGNGKYVYQLIFNNTIYSNAITFFE